MSWRKAVHQYNRIHSTHTDQHSSNSDVDTNHLGIVLECNSDPRAHRWSLGFWFFVCFSTSSQMIPLLLACEPLMGLRCQGKYSGCSIKEQV